MNSNLVVITLKNGTKLTEQHSTYFAALERYKACCKAVSVTAATFISQGVAIYEYWE
jgi:hypothetical protein